MSELFEEFDPDSVEAAYWEDPEAFQLALHDRTVEQATQQAMLAGHNAAMAQMQPLLQATTNLTVNAAEQILVDQYRRQGIELTKSDLEGAAKLITERNVVRIDDAVTNPHVMAERFGAAMELYLGEKAVKDQEESWERIKRSPGLSYSDLMKPRPRGDAA